MYEILIIGAGPAGISMAVEAHHAGIDPSKIILLEKMEEHSFSIKKYYPDNKLVTANYKGAESKCTGVMCIQDLSKNETISYLDKCIAEHNLTVHYKETVLRIHQNEDSTFVVYSDKGEYSAKIITVAIGILGKPNKPDYKIPVALTNSVLYDITSVKVNNSNVLVVGGGDSASEICQYLVQEGNEVTLSYRKSEFTRMNDINKMSLLALEEGNKVRILRESNVLSVEAKGLKPFVKFKEDNFVDESFDYIVYSLGGTTPQNFLKSIGIEFDGDKPALKPCNETSIKGLFLLGDLTAEKGGSINWAFNSSRTAMKKICNDYLSCEIEQV